MAELVKNNYDDFCDINAETSLFCGLDYDELINVTKFWAKGPYLQIHDEILKIVMDCVTLLHFFKMS